MKDAMQRTPYFTRSVRDLESQLARATAWASALHVEQTHQQAAQRSHAVRRAITCALVAIEEIEDAIAQAPKEST